jgi:hypothetical protein
MRVDLGEPEVQGGVPGGEVGEHAGHQATRRGGEGRHGQPARRDAPALFDTRLGALHDREQLLCGVDQLQRLGGEPDPPSLPFQQYGPCLPLQFGDLLGHGGGGVPERGGGRADRAVDGDGVQGAEALEI